MRSQNTLLTIQLDLRNNYHKCQLPKTTSLKLLIASQKYVFSPKYIYKKEENKSSLC